MFAVGYSAAADRTGFGSSIVAEVAQAHGWQIDVTDGADSETRFEITGITVDSTAT